MKNIRLYNQVLGATTGVCLDLHSDQKLDEISILSDYVSGGKLTWKPVKGNVPETAIPALIELRAGLTKLGVL